MNKPQEPLSFGYYDDAGSLVDCEFSSMAGALTWLETVEAKEFVSCFPSIDEARTWIIAIPKESAKFLEQFQWQPSPQSNEDILSDEDRELIAAMTRKQSYAPKPRVNWLKEGF